MIFQRTLLVGLGEAGALTVDLFLAGWQQQWAEIGVVQGWAVLAETLLLTTLTDPLLAPAEANFPAWQAEFEAQAAIRLRQISQLNYLSRLEQRGLSLRHPDEVYFIVVANPAEPWSAGAFAGVIESLRTAVYRTLNCQASVSGLLLVLPSAETESAESGESAEMCRQVERLAPYFDRGCFLAGLINEEGLVIGEEAELLRRAADFLNLLLQEPWLAEQNSLDAGCASFGLATIHWPAEALIDCLSARWSQVMLAELVTAPPVDPAQKARRVVEQWLIQEQLAPPLLLDNLVGVMPSLPLPLTALIPDPPWPWLLQGVQSQLEQAGQQWQEVWLAQQAQLEARLAGLAAAWPARVEGWLVEQVAGSRIGSVLLAQSCLAAMSERLQLFDEGVEQKLAEVEVDLIDLDRRLSQAAEALQAELATLPASLITALLRWGLRPQRWLRYWERCGRVQRLLQDFAYLVRNRLMTWQMSQYYESLLPFYGQLQAGWGEIVARWDHSCRQVVEAATNPNLSERAERLASYLVASAGPWQEAFVLGLYQEAVQQNQQTIWEAAGTLNNWGLVGLDSGEILRRLHYETGRALSTGLAIPVDYVLCRQLPDTESRERWLAGLAGQARPFWRYDETSLAETARSQASLKSWLLLPGGEQSPLAPLGQGWLQAPAIRAGREPETLRLVMLRFWPALPEPEGESTFN